MTLVEAGNYKYKYDLYCAIFRETGYKSNGLPPDSIGGFIERYLHDIGASCKRVNLSMNDLKHAVNDCCEVRLWKNYHPDKKQLNDLILMKEKKLHPELYKEVTE